MRWFRSDTKQEQVRVTVKLLHRAGNQITLQNVSKELADFMRLNIGRDKIYNKEDMAINLRDFSMVEVEKLA